jgi:hypothetical protein
MRVHGEGSGKPKEKEKDEEHFVTTNQRFYQTGKEMVGKGAGLRYKPGFLDGLKEKSDLLCAEKLRLSEDPQHNTIVQRTWIPARDPGVRARMEGGSREGPKEDNENSLPLGTGNYFKEERKDENAAYRKIRRDVTTYPDEHIRMAFR